MRSEPIKYKTEAGLCADFVTWVRAQGWVPYAETQGWDILLVAPDGTQIGVQAKLRFNLQVLAQCVPGNSWQGREGPDFRAVLVPTREGYAEHLSAALGVMCFYGDRWNTGTFYPAISGRGYSDYLAWHYWNPVRRHKLPEFVPDVPAGVAGPVQLTEWKVKALRIAAVLELRGHITRGDFTRYRLDHRRWTGPDGWLVANGQPGQWVWREGMPLFKVQHPGVYPQVLEAVRAELATVSGPPDHLI